MQLRRFHPTGLAAVKLKDGFLSLRQEINHTSTIPANIEKCETTGRFHAFELQWPPANGKRPHIFWDSDVAKVIEGICHDLQLHPDKDLEAELDKYVEKIISAQEPDGYLNTYFSVTEKSKRWKLLSLNHELYCAGHLIEAAIAYFETTGRRNFLEATCRYADLIGNVFGPNPGQLKGYPGHEEIELALCRLSEVTGEERYLRLARYFVEERGQSPNYFLMECAGLEQKPDLMSMQAHLPVREQKELVGHAVRAMYWGCGIADTAALTGDKELLAVAARLWESVIGKKMYVTGGIGSNPKDETLGDNYYLPNENAYAESCAAIGLALYSWRLLNIFGKGCYADVMERCIYNGVLSGISLSGTDFFYSNPLAFDSTLFTRERTGALSIKRQPWFFCSCCPTNFCRFIPQFGRFVVSQGDNEVRLHIPAAGEYNFNLVDGDFSFIVSGAYPYDGGILLKVAKSVSGMVCLSLRIPGWCAACAVKVNGRTMPLTPEDGYVRLERIWQAGDEVALDLDMPVQCVYANENVSANLGRIALMRGPLVYALEDIDNPDVKLSSLRINPAQHFTLTAAANLPEGTLAIQGTADVVQLADGCLYSPLPPAKCGEYNFTAIPYSLWQNRGEVSQMQVWMPRS